MRIAIFPGDRRIEWAIFAASVALAAGIVALMSSGWAMTLVIATAVGFLVVWIVVQDIRLLTISDAAILAIAVLAVASRVETARSAFEPVNQALLGIAVDAIVPGVLLLVFREIYYRRRGFDGLGLGDVKLAAAGGILVGTLGFSWALFSASLVGLGFVAVSRVAKRPFDDADRFAFGAVLAPALWAVWLAEQMQPLLVFADR